MAEFKTKGIYSSGMVLQRLTKNCIFGEAPANSEIFMTFGSVKASAKADSEGKWKLEFETGTAGGPFEMDLVCQNQKITFTDVYVGEVWISSGQSNAELPMVRMKYSYPEEFKKENPYVRMLTVPIAYNFDGEQDCINNPGWRAAGPETLGSMAGTGYFFAKKLSEDLKIPVGIINVAQGGSPIASWMSKKSLEELGNQQNLLDELAKWENPENIAREKEKAGAEQKDWNSQLWGTDQGIKSGWEKSSYQQVKDSWKNISIPGNIDVLQSAGIIWLKKEIELTKKQVESFRKNGANLWMGTIVDADTVYVNGVQTGSTPYCYPPRRYTVAADLLHEGKNTITLRIQNNSKSGVIRFYEEKPYALFTANLQVQPSICRNVEVVENRIPCGAVNPAVPEDSVYISLQGEWKMETGCKVPDCPPNKFFEWVPTALYNGMLSPCFNYAVAGALWYQGESDAYDAERYKNLLLKMIMLWRQKFIYAPEKMPFIIMQLPNWSDGYKDNPYSDNIGWPAMRQTQLLVGELSENVGLAVTIDAGEWNDLHPEKKKTAGTRAAIEALRIVYNKPYNSAPKAVLSKREGNKVKVQFETGTATLKSLSASVSGFYFLTEKESVEGKELKKVPAEGKIISGNEVEIIIPETDGKPLELRYLWADNPLQVDLYSTDNLPAAPFRAEIPE